MTEIHHHFSSLMLNGIHLLCAIWVMFYIECYDAYEGADPVLNKHADCYCAFYSSQNFSEAPPLRDVPTPFPCRWICS